MSISKEQDDQLYTFFEVILNTVNDAVTGVDTDGVVRYWNKTAETIYGISRDVIIGRKIGDFFPHGSLMIYQVMETKIPVYRVYHRPRPDKHVFINTVPVITANGKLLGTVSIEQDITNFVQLSAERYHTALELSNASYTPSLKAGGLNLTQMVELVSHSSAESPTYSFLIVGESGVGKRTLAEQIHRLSQLTGEFITVSCQQVPPGLIDLTLFGYEGGILGGQNEGQPGKLELAEKGTLFLMNIHTLPMSSQSRLAHALETGEFTRIGGTAPIRLNCQIVASTSPNIEALIAQGIVLPDLYYQFHIATILPLRERKQDLPGLCHHFLEQAARRTGRLLPRLTQETLAALTTYDWPGNLSQLRNAMEHIVMVNQTDTVSLTDLPPALRPTTLTDFIPTSPSLNALTEDIEKTTIMDALRHTNGNKARAARLLGISRGALYYKLQIYDIKF